MIIHYLKIAWRNLLKYKTQSVISILGLALGFTAFAFTLSWIRFGSYFRITFLSSLVSFPVGILIMQRWLEQYTRRVSMEWWLFAALFLLVLLFVTSIMIFRVYNAARENPSEVVKSA